MKSKILRGILVTSGLIIIFVLSKINTDMSDVYSNDMYPDVFSVIIGVHSIGIVIGILMVLVLDLLREPIITTFNKWKAKQQDKSLIRDESAVSYPLFTIILTLIIGTACYIILTPAINIVSGVMNTYIADGTISVQTANAYAFNLNLYKILPLFMIIGLFLYAITQALLRKGTEG